MKGKYNAYINAYIHTYSAYRQIYMFIEQLQWREGDIDKERDGSEYHTNIHTYTHTHIHTYVHDIE